MYLAQHPTVLQDIVSMDPTISKQAYCDVLFLNKPFDFWVPAPARPRGNQPMQSHVHKFNKL